MATRLLFPPPPAWARLLRSAPRLLVFDFDGTLAPMAASPGRARLPAGIRRALARLAKRRGDQVVILSARGLEDLRAKVGLPGLVYLGNHGLASNRPSLGLTAAELHFWNGRSAELARRIAPVARACPGGRLERKGPALALHFRLVDVERRPALLRLARRAVKGLPFVVLPGRGGLEFRPAGAGGKGEALRCLAGRFAPGWRRTGVLLYAGDDRSDEDAFAAARALGPRALGIKIGPGRTAARFRLDGAGDVVQLLEFLEA